MITVKVNPQRCPQNHFCPLLMVCQAGAIFQESPFRAPEIDYEKCTSCGKCAKFCGYGAVSAIKN